MLDMFFSGGFIMDIRKILVASTNKNKICQIEKKLMPLDIKVLNRRFISIYY